MYIIARNVAVLTVLTFDITVFLKKRNVPKEKKLM